MPASTTRKKRSSKRSPKRKAAAPKKRAPAKRKAVAPKRAPAKKRKVALAAKKRKIAPKKRAPAKRKAAPKKRAPKKRAPKKSAKRSAAAKKGWEKRRKKAELAKAMADLRMNARSGDVQPPGWIERRDEVREIDGERWQRYEVYFDQDAYDDERLSTLADLEIDLLNKDDLYDYLSWLAEELDIDIGDMYQMYLGYGEQEP
jgi:hypothetical protein